MFGFTDYAEYRRNEQETDRRTEQSRMARERKELARRRATEQRAAEHAAEHTRQAKAARTARPRVA